MTVSQDFKDAHAQWFETRLAKLKAEDGWLNLLGRWWVEDGTYTIGSAAECDVRLPVGPARLGTLTFNGDDKGTFTPADGDPVAIDKAAGPMAWRAGRFLLEITAPNARRALRIRDTEHDTEAALKPIPFYALDPALRITAKLEALPEPMTITLDTVIGVPTKATVTHRARFELGGEEVCMLATYGTPERPQFIFRDLTSLDETYGDMRFVFGEEVTEDSVVVDFNRAVNPPCAFTDHAICPLAPRENLFSLRIEAGEKRV
ncbi:DUF1684 domain-containing protein [Thalassorhabdomicrobium marinisediminis]|uniref:DUF1684 domain-containing protein n=1 Tax=Thalassorhabdomicrobium marinisediminis TaxID=2170577 RepID=A0A2T7FYZ5_9RHOB|nr:DUF1684 domain-containing protein [Thalassorhabdomicrobium marinisediminis]PVA07394.1 DUF1684 domain-containing protein [Thalassorhabdomicrobium marinisediminis]